MQSADQGLLSMMTIRDNNIEDLQASAETMSAVTNDLGDRVSSLEGAMAGHIADIGVSAYTVDDKPISGHTGALVTSAGIFNAISTATENVAYISSDISGVTITRNFDVQADTVWNKPQDLTPNQKKQARANIGLGVNGVIDLVPVSGSTNMVYSDGIYGAISAATASNVTTYDVSANHRNPNNSSTFSLAEAIALVPEAYHRGGLKLTFISNTTGRYEEWLNTASGWTTNTALWQGVTDKIYSNSNNLVSGKKIFEALSNIQNGLLISYSRAIGLTESTGMISISNSSDKDLLYIKIDENVETIEVDGAVFSDQYNYLYFDSPVPSTESYIGKNVTGEVLNGAVLALRNAFKAHNPDGYENAIVKVAYKVDTTPIVGSQKTITSGAVSKIGVINVSEEYPLLSGYYQITDKTEENYAPNAIPVNRRVRGTILKLETSQYNYELYLFDALSADPTSWSLPSRWKRIANEKDLSALAGGKMSTYSYTPVWTSLYDYATITDSTFNASEKSLVLIQFPNLNYKNPLRIIKVNNVDYDVKHYTGRNLKLYELNETSIFEFVFKDGVFYLINPCAKTDNVIDTKDGVNLYDLGLLEIGGIVVNGQDSTNNKRIRTKTNKLLKSPCNVYIKDGYKLPYVYKYTDDGYDDYITPGAAGYSGKVYKVDFDGYIRLLFQANENTEFDSVQDVGEITKYSGNNDDTVGVENLTLDNVENIITIGTSHTAGHGVVKNKSFIPYLSALYDWNFLNLGQDGSNYIQHLSYILNDTAFSSGSKFSDRPKNGGICLDFLGGSAEEPYWNAPGQGTNMELNMKRLYSVIRSYGYDIIIGSYFDHMYSIANIQNKVAEDLGLQFVDMHNECIRVGGQDKPFKPYYYSGHFCSRTVALQFYTFWKYAQIRRPRTAIKIFRNRNTAFDIDRLLYNNVFDRIELWDEISVSHHALRDNENNYVDRLDYYYDSGKRDATVSSEYTTLKNGGYVTFDKALVEFVLPSTAGGIKSLELHFNTNKNVNIYLRKYTDTDSVIPLFPSQCVFHLTSTEGLSVGDKLTSAEVGSGVTFTVTEIADNNVYCDSDNTISSFPGATKDTLTRVGDGATYECDSFKRSVPEGYQSRKDEPFGIWELAESVDNVVTLDDVSPYMDFDKVSVLLEASSGGTFNMYAPQAVYKFTHEKQYDRFYKLEAIKTKNVGDVIFEDRFGLSGATVGERGEIFDEGSSYTWNGDESYTTYAGDQTTENHIPQYYANKGCSQILHLKVGTKIQYVIDDQGANYSNTSIYNSANRVFKVTLVARYFPSSNLNINANTFTINSGTFDFGRIGIKSPINTDSKYFTSIEYVPASWVEVNTTIMLDAKAGNKLILEAIDNDVELLYIKFEKLL